MMARAMKDSGIEWIGEIPQEWNVKAAFQLFNQVKNKNTGLVEKNLLSLSYGKIKKKSIDTVGGLLPDSFDGYNIIESGDIVLRLTDLQNDHTSLRVGLSNERGIVTSAYVSLHNVSSNLPIYLYYYLHTFDVCKGFYGMGAGVRQGLNWEGLKLLKFVLPPLPEQERIAEFLDKRCAEMDKVIADTQKTIEEYKALKQSIITEAVTKGIRKSRPMKDSCIDWIGEIPQEWELIRGKFIFSQRNERGNRIECQLLSPTQKYGVIPQTLYEKLSGMKAVKLDLSIDYNTLKSIYKGDFCISLRSFQGGFEYSEYNGVVSPAYQVFYAIDEKANKRYFKYFFKEHGFIEKMASFTKSFRDGKNISYEDFANSIVPLPTWLEQNQIADFIEKKTSEIDKLISAKEQLLTEMESYKKSVIYEYVTGKKEL